MIHIGESLEFELTVGITEGYNHNNEGSNIDFISILQNVCSEVENLDDCMYISFVIKPAIVVYKEEWGCPKEGENVYIISSVLNKYYDNSDIVELKWVKSCREIALRLQRELNQSTITGLFRKVSTLYIKAAEE